MPIPEIRTSPLVKVRRSRVHGLGVFAVKPIKKGTRILSRGEGVYVWDSLGNKLLDAFAGLWCVNIGYGRSELGAVAAKQMTQLAYYNSFFGCTTAPTVAATPPGNL